jgi:hypothetical protein
LNCENINIIKEITRDKCIPSGIKDDNVPPKFVVPVEKTTLNNHNLCKSGLENINSNNYGIYGNKGKFIIMV